MESYEEFARRARIMTEIHALPPVESSSCGGKVNFAKPGAASDPEVMKQSALQKKEKDAKKKSLKRL
jgi:hypothetical protein